MWQVMDIGAGIDTVTPGELQQALLDQDARVAETLRGVKYGEVFINATTIGATVQQFSTTGGPPQSPAAGFVWSIMNIGVETSSSQALRVWKQIPGGLISGTSGVYSNAGSGRLVGTVPTSSSAVGADTITYSKGQLILRAGDVLSFAAASTANLLSIYWAYFEVPAERIGEFIL